MGLSRLTFYALPSVRTAAGLTALTAAGLIAASNAFGAVDGKLGDASSGEAKISVKIAPQLRFEKVGLTPDSYKVRSNQFKFDILRVDSEGKPLGRKSAASAMQSAQILVLIPR